MNTARPQLGAVPYTRSKQEIVVFVLRMWSSFSTLSGVGMVLEKPIVGVDAFSPSIGPSSPHWTRLRLCLLKGKFSKDKRVEQFGAGCMHCQLEISVLRPFSAASFCKQFLGLSDLGQEPCRGGPRNHAGKASSRNLGHFPHATSHQWLWKLRRSTSAWKRI